MKTEQIARINDIYPNENYVVFDNGAMDTSKYLPYLKEESLLIDKLNDEYLPEAQKDEVLKQLKIVQSELINHNFQDQKKKFNEGLRLLKVSKQIDNDFLKEQEICGNIDSGEIYGLIDDSLAMGRFKLKTVEGTTLLFIPVSHVYSWEIRDKAGFTTVIGEGGK